MLLYGFKCFKNAHATTILISIRISCTSTFDGSTEKRTIPIDVFSCISRVLMMYVAILRDEKHYELLYGFKCSCITGIDFNTTLVYRYLCWLNENPYESNWCICLHSASPIDVCSHCLATIIIICFFMASNASKMLTQQRHWLQYEFHVPVPLSDELKTVRVQLMFFLAFRESYWCM